MSKKCLISFVIIFIFQSFATLKVNAQLISRDLLIQDVRQLSDILESSHPDPYINGGGKIAFHLRLQSILSAIPDSGMSKPDFVSLIEPLAASVSDAHTSIYNINTTDWEYPGGVPLYFDVIENFLYVKNVPDSSYIHLIGSILLSVEGIPLSELIERQKMLKGCDNDYTALAILARFGSLFQKNIIKNLIPEWKTENRIVIKLKLPTGEIKEQVFELPWKIKYPFGIKTQSSITLPSTKRCDFNYDFIDEKKQTAILKIDGMVGYREDFELSATSHTMDGLKEAWKQYYGTEPPENQSDIIAGIPSAAEMFKNLIEDMKKAGTKTLIVDVRENTGGNSMMTDFLIFCLFGKEQYY